MGMQRIEDFEDRPNARIGLIHEFLVRWFGKRDGYHRSLLTFFWRGQRYIVK